MRDRQGRPLRETSDEFDDEWEDEEFEEDDEYPADPWEDDENPGGPGTGMIGGAREAFALLYCAIALTFIWFHGAPRNLDANWRLFAWFGTNFVVLFCIPAAIIHFLWRRPLSRYGLQLGDVGTWGRYFVFFFTLMVPLVLIMSRQADFHLYYPRFEPARTHWGFLLLSAGGWLVYFFAWEWFYRGFLLFSLAPSAGGGVAIMVQTIPFVMMHYPKLEAEAWSSIICGIALGLMAYRGRSFVGTWLLHWAVATSMDLTVLLWPLHSGG